MSETVYQKFTASKSFPPAATGFERFTHMFVRMGKTSKGATIPGSN